jgi:hypothetical protein
VARGGERPRTLFGEAEPPAAAGGYAHVALQKPVRREFTYALSPEQRGLLEVGMRVAVSLAIAIPLAMLVGALIGFFVRDYLQ